MVQYFYDLSHLTEQQRKSERSLLTALKAHDSESFYFSYCVGLLNVAILKQFGIAEKEMLHGAFKAGFLHDIGKLGMSSDFLNFPGAFTLQIFNEMKKHPQGGAELLEAANSNPHIIQSTMFHHCNIDGSGYPGDLYDNEIPLFARPTRITDSIDAFLSKRAYKEGGESAEVYRDLLQYRGTSYDPLLLESFRIIHEKTIDACRVWGEERPSKDVYIHFLASQFAPEYYRQDRQNLIDLI